MRRDVPKQAVLHRRLRALLLVATGLVVIAAIVVAGGLPRTIWGFPGSSAVWSMAFVGAGFLADQARPDIPVGILLMLAGVSAALQELLTQVVLGSGDEMAFGLAIIAQAMSWTWMIPVSLLITALLRFPDGTRLGPGWRWIETLLWVGTAATAVVFTIGPSPGEFGNSNPLEIPAWSRVLGVANNVAQFAWRLVSVIAVLSIVVRLRRSTGVERQQVKWVAFAGAALALLVLTVEGVLGAVRETLYRPASALVAISIVLVPIAIAMAMLRYRLYDVDRVVSRSVAYSLVAALLALVYAGGVVALQTISPASGNLAVAASTLAVAVLFNPVRLRVQRWVDRRFNRASYDAGKEVDAFTSRLRSAVDPTAITLDLGAVLDSTIQPSSAQVWIRAEPRA